jgi:hypothetical protein
MARRGGVGVAPRWRGSCDPILNVVALMQRCDHVCGVSGA